MGIFTAAALTLAIAAPRPPVLAPEHRANYGHYFATRYSDTHADAAMLCAKPGVTGVNWRRTWAEIEREPGVYDFSSFDDVMAAVRPGCRVWLFVEWRSYAASPIKNPCPAHIASALNADGAQTCLMHERAIAAAYVAMLRELSARFDANVKFEGVILQETALGFNGAFSQDVANGGTYTAARWRDALVQLVEGCADAFKKGRCMSFLNFIRGGQDMLGDVAGAIAKVPNRRSCFAGPDILPGNGSLDSVYGELRTHKGCRANSAQNDSYQVAGCGLNCIFDYAVSNLCVNSYLFWNHRVGTSATGLDWTDALPVIAAQPYGYGWLDQCPAGGPQP